MISMEEPEACPETEFVSNTLEGLATERNKLEDLAKESNRLEDLSKESNRLEDLAKESNKPMPKSCSRTFNTLKIIKITKTIDTVNSINKEFERSGNNTESSPSFSEIRGSEENYGAASKLNCSLSVKSSNQKMASFMAIGSPSKNQSTQRGHQCSRESNLALSSSQFRFPPNEEKSQYEQNSANGIEEERSRFTIYDSLDVLTASQAKVSHAKVIHLT